MNRIVSVIIPVYNVEKYLGECLDSVVGQTYTDLDIVLVDDGSPDNCGEICEQYASRDKRIKVIHKENGGLSDARNVGLSSAKGEYVYFLDSDDYLKMDAIEKLVSFIEKESADIICFDSETIYEDFIDKDYSETFIRKHHYNSNTGAQIFESQLKNNEYYSCVPLLFFSSSFLHKSNLKFLKGIMHEDELFTAIAFIKAKCVACLQERLYVRRLRASSIMEERISVKSINGLISCINGFLDEITAYKKGSTEFMALGFIIKNKLIRVYEEYYKIQKNERLTVCSRLKDLKKRLSSVKFLGSFKIFLLCNFTAFTNAFLSIGRKNSNSMFR